MADMAAATITTLGAWSRNDHDENSAATFAAPSACCASPGWVYRSSVIDTLQELRHRVRVDRLAVLADEDVPPNPSTPRSMRGVPRACCPVCPKFGHGPGVEDHRSRAARL